MAIKKVITRQEVLGGLAGRTTKQAHALLALIENQTAHLVAQAEQAGAVALTIPRCGRHGNTFSKRWRRGAPPKHR